MPGPAELVHKKVLPGTEWGGLHVRRGWRDFLIGGAAVGHHASNFKLSPRWGKKTQKTVDFDKTEK